MKLFKKLAAALLALTMVASMAACGSSSGSASAASEAAKSEAPAAAASEAAKPEAPAAAASEAAGSAAAGDVDVNAAMSGKTIGYVTVNGAAPWSGVIGTKLNEFVTAAGGTCKILDAQTDTAKLAEYCQQMIDASVDALVIFGGDPSANSDIAKTADEAGIPVFMAALDLSLIHI